MFTPDKCEMQQLFIIATYKIAPNRNNFIAHIPIRIRRLLGDSVAITFVFCGEVNEEVLRKEGIRIIRLEIRDGCFFYWNFLLALGKILRKERPDAVMNMNLHIHNLIFGFWGRYFGIHTIARVTGNVFYNRPHSLGSYLMRLRKRLWEICSLLTMNRIICLSESLKKQLPMMDIILKKTHILSPGIETCGGITQPHQIRDIDLLFVGRMEKIKNVDFAISVFKEMLNVDGRINFHLLGNGSLLDEYRRSSEKISNIHFHGEVEHKKTFQFMQRSKCLILCSRAEGFGNVILEAMICKTFVAVTPVSDMKHIIGEKHLGLLIEPGQVSKTAREILGFLDDSEKRSEICEKAFQYVNEFHSFEILRPQYLDILFNPDV